LFAAYMKRREDRIDLALAALLIPAEEYPRLVVEDYIERIDVMAAGLAVEIDLEASPAKIAGTISAFLSEEQGFDGDREDYYGPRNSYLNEVMDRRRGLPITLSIVYIEVARRVGVELLPVSMPGHFLVKMLRDDLELFLDPFNGGDVLDVHGCRRLFQSVQGAGPAFRESMLGAATRRQVIRRVLQNLKSAYLDQQEFERALRTIDVLLTLAPWDLDEVRERGLLLSRLGRTEEARRDLQAYVDHGPSGPARESARAALRRIASP